MEDFKIKVNILVLAKLGNIDTAIYNIEIRVLINNTPVLEEILIQESESIKMFKG